MVKKKTTLSNKEKKIIFQISFLNPLIDTG